jgi:hypothetical protein
MIEAEGRSGGLAMTLNIDFGPQVEAELLAVASQNGITPSELVQKMLVGDLPPLPPTVVPRPSTMITQGMFPGLAGLTDDDFKVAEFHGDLDDGLD